MERADFLNLLAEGFYPSLRAEAFRGSGTTLRRIQEPVVHVVNIQGSTSSDGFYVNLGAHLAFLPMEGGGMCVPSKLKESECAFRARIDPSTEGALKWPYGRRPADAEVTVEQLAEEWQRQGRSFFKKYSTWPDDFAGLVKAALISPPQSRDGLKSARIALQLGLREEAVALARQSLTTVPSQATGLRGSLKRFLDEIGAA